MGTYTWLLGVLFLLVCWCLGVYKRLTRLRARAVQAVASMHATLALFKPLIQTRVAEFADIGEPWLEVTGIAQQMENDLQAALPFPLNADLLRQLMRSTDALQRAWIQACAEPEDLAGGPLPVDLRAQWDEVAYQAQAARALVNQELVLYNQAVSQAPAAWFGRALGLKTVTYF